MNDFGLDLAVIGNGRSAALLDPTARIVWWCYPRFDGDPVFSRLLAGGEEKGFCDVLLEGMVDFASEYVRNTAVVSIRPHLSAAAHADHRAGRRPAPHHSAGRS